MHKIKFIYKFNLFLLPFIVLVANTNSFAQSSNTSSPYSRYGIGDVYSKGFAQNFALGGTHIAMQNDSTHLFFINTGNPASYSNFGLTTAELGFNYSRVQLKSSVSKKTANNAALAYVSIALPIKKWWGCSFGILPYSSVGYKISDHSDLVSAGEVGYLYEGEGGIDEVYFGTAVKPFYGLPKAFLKSKKYERLKLEADKIKITRTLKRKKLAQGLSLGANAVYLFGNIENSKRVIFNPRMAAYNTRSVTSTRATGLRFDYGTQYAFAIDSLHGRDLKENVKLTIGATFSAQTNINALVDTLTYNFKYGSSGEELMGDTVRATSPKKGNITLPLSVGFGLGFKKGNKWVAALDFSVQNWSSYKAFNQSPLLKNSMRVSGGVQYTPNPIAEDYYKRIQYRAGTRYAKTALELRNTPLEEYALSIGLGLPVGRNYMLQNFSMVNIGVEFGQRGTVTNGLIQESFMKVNVGFTINDKWFVKPKID